MPPANTPKPNTPKANSASRNEDEDLDERDDEMEEGEKVEGPDDESFDEKYNKRLEFPISLVSAIFFHVFIAACGALILLVFMVQVEDRSGVPVKLVNVHGLDDDGMGSAGSGGLENPDIISDSDSFKGLESLADPNKTLPDIKENSPTMKYLDEFGKMPVSPSNQKAYDSLNDKVRNQLLGSRQGAGNEKGKGFDGGAGKGPGGTGADSTFGRNMRWVLRFKVTSGADYLEQLKAMEAEILVPIPPSNEKCILIADITKPHDHKVASDDDMRRLGNKIKFSDNRPEAVKGVARSLGLDFSPGSFWAFFPKKIEDELSKKETGFRNRQAQDIDETIFRVAVKGSSFELIVDEQKVKR